MICVHYAEMVVSWCAVTPVLLAFMSPACLPRLCFGTGSGFLVMMYNTEQSGLVAVLCHQIKLVLATYEYLYYLSGLIKVQALPKFSTGMYDQSGFVLVLVPVSFILVLNCYILLLHNCLALGTWVV